MIETRESLLGRLKVDNAQEAWKEFYELYWRAILRYGRKLGLTEHQAEEVLQETMVALMRILPEFAYDRGKGRFRNFLLTIVHRKSLAALRRARRERDSRHQMEASVWAGVEDTTGQDQPADEEAMNRWREVLLAEALRELRIEPAFGEQTYAVFEAYVIEKRPAAEVAAQFRLKENAVYQIKNRMMRRLETRIAQLVRDSGGP